MAGVSRLWCGRHADGETGACVLSAIAVLSLWAAYATWNGRDSWLKASLINQLCIFFLAAYVFYIDRESLHQQTFGIAGFAFCVGMAALMWEIYLVLRAYGPIPEGLKSIAAVVPLGSLIQYWTCRRTTYRGRQRRSLT